MSRLAFLAIYCRRADTRYSRTSAMMLKIKLAARRQIRALLTPDQQKKIDEDIAQLSK